MSGEKTRSSGAPFFETNEGADGIARDVFAAAAVAALRKDPKEALRVCEMLGRIEATHMIGRKGAFRRGEPVRKVEQMILMTEAEIEYGGIAEEVAAEPEAEKAGESS